MGMKLSLEFYSQANIIVFAGHFEEDFSSQQYSMQRLTYNSDTFIFRIFEHIFRLSAQFHAGPASNNKDCVCIVSLSANKSLLVL